MIAKCKIPLKLLPIETQLKYRNDIDLLDMNNNYDCKYYKKKWYKICLKNNFIFIIIPFKFFATEALKIGFIFNPK